jgi:hypothetical protein
MDKTALMKSVHLEHFLEQQQQHILKKYWSNYI